MGDSLMSTSLQPIVATVQQLIRAPMSRTMQPMVASAKDDERKAFANRLNDAIDALPSAPRRGRPAWLLVQLKSRDPRLKLSQEAVRKWLAGESMPDQTHMAMLARVADCDSDYLHTGRGSAAGRTFAPSPALHGFPLTPEAAHCGNEWQKLDTPMREAVLELVELLVARQKRGKARKTPAKRAVDVESTLADLIEREQIERQRRALESAMPSSGEPRERRRG